MMSGKAVEFVSYDGEYPNLCSGTLVLKINGEEVEFPKYCMHSGGRVYCDDGWNFCTEEGPWTVDVPIGYRAYQTEIENVVNEEVPWGCCGGCI